MRKGKMPIPRVKWFDDLFSMDLISKVVTSGFEDPFMFLKSTWILWLRLVVDRRLIMMIDVYAVLGQLGVIGDLRGSPLGESCDCWRSPFWKR
jgi:hypothetical protein